MSVITNSREKVRNKSVLLFSGGMDSVMFSKLLDPDVLLYIPTESSYTDRETRAIDNLISKGIIDSDKLIKLDNTLNLKRFERDDYIVPNRNAFLILLASMYGETIYLGSVYGDRSKDKDKEFYKLMENLLNHMWCDQHWTEERKFKILDPFKDTTKTELLKMYIDKGYSANDILESYSCYEGKECACGICKPCSRKWVALVNNNIKIPSGYFENNPSKAEWITKVLPLMREGKYRGREDFEFISALRKVGEIE